MSSVALRRSEGLAGPFALSVLLHGAAIAALVFVKAAPPPALPPMYRVDLVAAPASEAPQAGIVRPPNAPEPETATKVPPKAATTVQGPVAPVNAPSRRRQPTQATPNITPQQQRVAASEAQSAGGGEQGGTGNDVATVRTEGIDFPFPGYLQNIVRQVAQNFRPNNPGALRAEVFFFIKRDGTVTGFRFVERSGNFAFDLEASGAVEAAARGFGPLPREFPNDILGVTFTFDPARLR